MINQVQTAKSCQTRSHKSSLRIGFNKVKQNHPQVIVGSVRPINGVLVLQTFAFVASSELITITFLLSFTLSRLDANFFIIFLQCRQILTRFTELASLHSFANIPMDKGTF